MYLYMYMYVIASYFEIRENSFREINFWANSGNIQPLKKKVLIAMHMYMVGDNYTVVRKLFINIQYTCTSLFSFLCNFICFMGNGMFPDKCNYNYIHVYMYM